MWTGVGNRRFGASGDKCPLRQSSLADRTINQYTADTRDVKPSLRGNRVQVHGGHFRATARPLPSILSGAPWRNAIDCCLLLVRVIYHSMFAHAGVRNCLVEIANSTHGNIAPVEFNDLRGDLAAHLLQVLAQSSGRSTFTLSRCQSGTGLRGV